MIPTLTKPGLAELPPKSAYDKLAFIEAHYDELCEMYQTIMEHIKAPQVEGGSGCSTKEYSFTSQFDYVYFTGWNKLYSSKEEAIKMLPLRMYSEHLPKARPIYVPNYQCPLDLSSTYMYGTLVDISNALVFKVPKPAYLNNSGVLPSIRCIHEKFYTESIGYQRYATRGIKHIYSVINEDSSSGSANSDYLHINSMVMGTTDPETSTFKEVYCDVD